MIDKCKSSLLRQIVWLLACTAISAFLALAFDLEPRLRAGLKSTVLGVFFGPGILLVSMFTAAGLSLVKTSLIYPALRREAGRLGKMNLFERIGAAIVSGFGEEMLLRGFVFSLLATTSITLALAANFLLAAALFHRSRSEFFWTLIKGLEATLLALYYLWFPSLFFLAVARTVYELIYGLGLPSALMRRVLENELVSLNAVRKWLKERAIDRQTEAG